jgi:hypothetical protein
LQGGSGNNLLISRTGCSQMMGASGGNTMFEIAYHTGNDSITASGSGDVAFIDGRASTDGTIVTAGVQVLYFSDGAYSA